MPHATTGGTAAAAGATPALGFKEKYGKWVIIAGIVIVVAFIVMWVWPKKSAKPGEQKPTDAEIAAEQERLAREASAAPAPAAKVEAGATAKAVAAPHWPAVVLTDDIRNTKPTGVAGSDEVVAWFVCVGDAKRLTFDKPGDRTGWIFAPEESSVRKSPAAGNGIEEEFAAGGPQGVPGGWLRWKRVDPSVQGVYPELVDLGEHRR